MVTPRQEWFAAEIGRTPIFLDRFLLNKPPLLMWLGAASMRWFGIAPPALRAPVLACGVLCCVLIYWWVRRSRSSAAAGPISAVVLLLGTPVFHSISRKFMTDTLLTLFVVAAMFVVAASSPRWERRATAIVFGVFSGSAVMTESAAGFAAAVDDRGLLDFRGIEGTPAAASNT